MIGVPALAIASSVMVRQAGVIGGLLGTAAMFGLLCAPRFGLLRRHFESLGFPEVELAHPAPLGANW